MTIDLTQIILAIISGVFTILGIIITAVVSKYVKDKQMAALLTNAVANSLGKLQQVAEGEVTDLTVTIPHVPPELTPAVQYVIDHAKDALDHFGITPEAVADKITAQIGLKNITANLALNTSGPVAVKPLAAVPRNL